MTVVTRDKRLDMVPGNHGPAASIFPASSLPHTPAQPPVCPANTPGTPATTASVPACLLLRRPVLASQFGWRRLGWVPREVA